MRLNHAIYCGKFAILHLSASYLNSLQLREKYYGRMNQLENEKQQSHKKQHNKMTNAYKRIRVSSSSSTCFSRHKFSNSWARARYNENTERHIQTSICLERLLLRCERKTIYVLELCPPGPPSSTLLIHRKKNRNTLFIAHNLQLNKQIINSEPLYCYRVNQPTAVIVNFVLVAIVASLSDKIH